MLTAQSVGLPASLSILVSVIPSTYYQTLMCSVVGSDLLSIRDSQCTYNVTFRCVRATIVAVEKQEVLTYSACAFVALGIQHAKLMRRIILSSVACSIFPH